MLSANTLITLLQALQLTALAPCLFVIIFLLVSSKKLSDAVVPVLYFAALAATFLLPLINIWPAFVVNSAEWMRLYGGLLFAQSLLPALSFLLIMQFMKGRPPRPLYWLVLGIPLLGGSPMVYVSLVAGELCMGNVGCLSTEAIQGLYASFSTAILFLLLTIEFSRTRNEAVTPDSQRKNKYWLIIALIVLNLMLLAVELAHIAEELSATDVQFISTMLRITFIYLVLTMLFRLFDAGSARAKSQKMENKDAEVGEAFTQLMEEERLYREASCNREEVARRLAVNENYLSRVINQRFKQRFTDIVNHYRVEEAKERLVADPDVAITNIAFDVGFNSIPSFNRVFKDSTGHSPSEYRSKKGAVDIE